MRRSTVLSVSLALFGLTPIGVRADRAPAVAAGTPVCADTTVEGDITSQSLEHVKVPGIDHVNTYLRVEIDVRRVRHGTVEKGPLTAEGLAYGIPSHLLNDKTVHLFYLNRRPGMTWWIADCYHP